MATHTKLLPFNAPPFSWTATSGLPPMDAFSVSVGVHPSHPLKIYSQIFGSVPSLSTQIMEFVLQRHMKGCHLHTVDRPIFSKAILPGLSISLQMKASYNLYMQSTPLGAILSPTTEQKKIIQAFDELKSLLCSLSGLPLAVKSVKAGESSLSYLGVFYHSEAHLQAGKAFPSIYKVVLEFENSNSWPSDKEAIKHLKTAFLLNMRTELSANFGMDSFISEDYLDIPFPVCIFRVSIFHPREFLHNHPTEAFSMNSSVRPSVENLSFLQRLWWRPAVALHLQTVALAFSAFIGAVRLTKLWFSKQMLPECDDLVEHVMAYLFLHPSPFSSPTSPHVAFVRFLWLLTTFKWRDTPLFLELDRNQPFTEEQRKIIRDVFERSHMNKNIQGDLPRFWIATSMDPRALFISLPSSTMCGRILALARTHLKLVKEIFLAPHCQMRDWYKLFTPDLQSFDLLIRLKTPHTDKNSELAHSLSLIVENGRRLAIPSLSNTLSALQFCFNSYITQLKQHIGNVSVVCYDSLVQPMPLLVGVKFIPSCFLFTALSPTAETP
ncbi:hypothetical protein IE077_001446, partial [Cardiosporidium cionae]